MRRVVLATLLAVAAPALAEATDSGDEAALRLADQTRTTAQGESDWHVFTEAAWSRAALRRGGLSPATGRLSLDLRYDGRFAGSWRAVLADRLDTRWQGNRAGPDSINTLKEAYLSWQASPTRLVDFGRINARYGVAYGYNPTDYLRAGAVRSVVSIDPASLRENRLGSVMLRAQTLWSGGSLSVLYSPRLADRPSDTPFNPDFGASNGRDRWLLAFSQRLAPDFSPQWLLAGGAGQSVQAGLNVTALLNAATVAYLEASGGRSRSLLSQALQRAGDEEWRTRAAAGLTYTTADKLSLTAEYEHNDAGLGRDAWDALRRGAPTDYARYRAFSATVQDPPTRERLFVRAAWQDALVLHLDLTGNFYADLQDHSRLSWLEARYHWQRVDLAVQWQHNAGTAGSDYGAAPERSVWQVQCTYFF